MIREVNACTGHKHNGKGLTEIRNTNSLGTHVEDCPKYSGQLDVVKVSSWQLETRFFHPVKVMEWLIPYRQNNGLFEIVHSGIQRLILGDWSTLEYPKKHFRQLIRVMRILDLANKKSNTNKKQRALRSWQWGRFYNQMLMYQVTSSCFDSCGIILGALASLLL